MTKWDWESDLKQGRALQSIGQLFLPLEKSFLTSLARKAPVWEKLGFATLPLWREDALHVTSRIRVLSSLFLPCIQYSFQLYIWKPSPCLVCLPVAHFARGGIWQRHFSIISLPQWFPSISLLMPPSTAATSLCNLDYDLNNNFLKTTYFISRKKTSLYSYHVQSMAGNHTNKNNIYIKEYVGLPWWCSGWESACQCRGHRFEPWSGKIPHAAERLGPCATTTEPARLEPVLCNKRGRDSERTAHRDEEWPPLAVTRESPRTETKTQHSQK